MFNAAVMKFFTSIFLFLQGVFYKYKGV